MVNNYYTSNDEASTTETDDQNMVKDECREHARLLLLSCQKILAS